jgi:hypothetical protein
MAKQQINSIEDLALKEARMIQELRDYYRFYFISGESDDSFLRWLESKLKERKVNR